MRAIGMVLTVLAAAAAGQQLPNTVQLPFESRPAAARLENAGRLCRTFIDADDAAALVAEAGIGVQAPLRVIATLGAVEASQPRWSDALREYQRLLYDAGDALAAVAPPVNATARTALRVRDQCHAAIAAMPPSILALYREQVDAAANKLLDEGLASRDERMLRRLLSEYFCSRAGEQALDALGDLAFERGHFEEAIHWWRRLAPPAWEKERVAGCYPDPSIDPARIRAKQILALIFQGQTDEASRELAAFAAVHAQAKGTLAGRTGSYVDILQHAVHEINSRAAIRESQSWPTFAGSFTRSRMTAASPDPRLWAAGAAWQAMIQDEPSRLAAAGIVRYPHFPLIAGDLVLLNDTRRVRAFDLHSGRSRHIFDLHAEGHVDEPGDAPASASPGLHCGVTALGDCIYACLAGLNEQNLKSFLFCLEIHAKEGFRERWHVIEADGRFDGSPVVFAGRVFVALSQRRGKRAQTAIMCYDAANGAQRWSQPICETFERDEQSPRPLQMLTLAGPNIVCCTHSGAIVAVDRFTGKPAWAVRYLGGAQVPAHAEPCPCLYGRQRVFAAPLDSRQVYCTDAAAGAVLWERDSIAVKQLLGVTANQLLLTTEDGLRAIDIDTGLDSWQQPAVSRLATAARGFLAGGWIFWPTEDRHLPIRTLAALDGSQEIFRRHSPPMFFDPTQMRLLPPGNCAYASGSLVIAGQSELFGYVPAVR